jgi:MAC/Perforin domain
MPIFQSPACNIWGGYDVFGRYASPDSCEQRIIDFDGQEQIETQIYDESLPLAAWKKSFSTIPAELKMLYLRPKNTSFLGEYKIEWDQEFQSSAEDQVKKWSANVDVKASYGAFSGEVGVRLNSFYSKLTTAKYWSLVGKNTYYTLRLEDSHRQPAPLIPDVQSDLDDVKFPPRDFFQKYGTHYLREVTIGSRVTITKSVDTSKIASDFDFAAHLKAAYKGPKLEAKVTADAAYQTKLRQFEENCKEYIEGTGFSDPQIKSLKEGSNTTVAVLMGGGTIRR